jgi:hypothetical protein
VLFLRANRLVQDWQARPREFTSVQPP